MNFLGMSTVPFLREFREPCGRNLDQLFTLDINFVPLSLLPGIPPPQRLLSTDSLVVAVKTYHRPKYSRNGVTKLDELLQLLE